MSRAPEQFELRDRVNRLGIGVVRAQPQTVGDGGRCECLVARRDRLADIDVRGAGCIGVDEIGDIVVVSGHTEAKAVVGNGLLESEIVADALFRQQIRIAEKIEGRPKIDV